jgi:tungstate transport system substrate-binding protein
MTSSNRLFIFMILSALLLSACQPTAPQVKDMILATTTSTQDSGLLDILVPVFEESSGYIVKIVAVGTGQALTMGEEGNADVLLVHAPASEVAFMDAGHGTSRVLIMHNDFVLVGPTDDPAGIKGLESASAALQAIASTNTLFISRGDDSGTHKMELSLWKAAGLEPAAAAWIEQTGQGMGATLRVASEKSAYTLTDRATYLANQDTLDLEILVEGDASLLNIYHVITVNPEKSTLINAAGAQALADFLVSPPAQELIREFGVDKYGQPLFFPDAGKAEDALGQ